MSDDETRSLWFNPSAAEDLDREYTLIGMLLGLAIYNSVILDIQFPPVLYRKLMGKVGSFVDLETSHPVSVFTLLTVSHTCNWVNLQTIYNSLKSLIAFNEEQEGTTVEDAFGLTYQVGITDATGSRILLELKENGSDIPVTNTNRDVIDVECCWSWQRRDSL